MSATVGERGGGSAPAQRRNLSPAHDDTQATYRDVLVEHSGAASGEPAVGSGPTGPATEGRRGGGAAPAAQRRNLSPARGNSPTTFRSEMAARGGTFSGELAASGEPANSKYHSLPAYVTEPYQHTPPVDYEEVLTPVLSSSARNLEEAAKPWDGDIPRRLETGAEWFAPPSRSAGMWQGRPASPPRTVQGISGRVTGPSGVVPLAGGQGHDGFPVHTPRNNVDPYGSGQPLPPPPARQLTGSILRSCDTAVLDAIQGEADSFPYNGSVKARNALFLDTELRYASMLTGFLGELG